MGILRRVGTSVTVAEVCRQRGLNEVTYYSCKKKYGGWGVPKLRRTQQLEEEKQPRNQLVVD